jgi:hypothetical protein
MDHAAVACTLDLGPVVRLQKRMWQIAFFSGLAIYLEGVLALVLVTEQLLSPGALAVLAGILIAQLRAVYWPVRQLVRGELARRHRAYLALLGAFIVAVSLGSPAGDARVIGAIMSTLVSAIGAWAAMRAIRVETELGPRLVGVEDATVLSEALSFSPREAVNARLRAVGGEGSRWVVLAAAAGLTFAVMATLLANLSRALGVNAGTIVAQGSTFAAVFVFYMTMRRLKLSASQLRQRDQRAPVLILRRFRDDFIESGKWSFGAAPTFEHFVAAELNRVGPVIAIGKPGERLQPLGAARDYLEDADWKTAVGTAIADSALTVFVLGATDSLLWEFRTAVERRGKRRTLVIVPPLADRAELARRWTRFVAASADILGAGFPGDLPDRSVLAISFIGDEAVMMVSDERPRSRAVLVRSRSDYRLMLRLFECLSRQDLPSASALEHFARTTLPIARVTTA